MHCASLSFPFPLKRGISSVQRAVNASSVSVCSPCSLDFEAGKLSMIFDSSPFMILLSELSPSERMGCLPKVLLACDRTEGITPDG